MRNPTRSERGGIQLRIGVPVVAGALRLQFLPVYPARSERGGIRLRILSAEASVKLAMQLMV